MLAKQYRVTKALEFKRIYQKGKFFSNGELLLRILPNRRPYNRFAVVVFKKHIKKATDRNRLKRQLREIIRKHSGELLTAFDIIVVVNKDLSGRDFAELEKSLAGLFKKGGLTTNEANRDLLN